MSLGVASCSLRRVASDSRLSHLTGEEEVYADDSCYDYRQEGLHEATEPLDLKTKKKKKGLLHKMGFKKKKRTNSPDVLSQSFNGHTFNGSNGSDYKNRLLGDGEVVEPQHHTGGGVSEPRPQPFLLDSDSSQGEVPVVRVHKASVPAGSPPSDSPPSSPGSTPHASPVLSGSGSRLAESHRMMSLQSRCLSQSQPPQSELLRHSSSMPSGGLSFSQPLAPASPPAPSQPSLTAPPGSTFALHLTLMEGLRLAVRDRGGTSDPYVKFRLGDQKYRSRTVMRNLNPKWQETFVLWTTSLRDPLLVKVYDYDRGWTDDYMGGTSVDLSLLPLNQPVRRILKLEDASSLEEDLGCLVVSFELKSEVMSPEGLEMVQGVTSLKKAKHTVTMSKLRQWNSILTVAVLRGISLPALEANDCHPYVKLKMGSQHCKTRVLHRTTEPNWKEQFDLRMYEGESQSLHFELWDRMLRKKDKFMGSCSVDLCKLQSEVTQELKLDLEEGEGKIHVLLTISGHSVEAWSEKSLAECEVMQSSSNLDWNEVTEKYSLLNTHKTMKDVGFLQLTIEKAVDLACQRHSCCDPVAMVEVGNTQVRTTTLSRTTNPVWNKTFNIHVKDIHEVLNITVYSGDSTRGSEFVGTVAIPLLKLGEGPQSYQLKDKACVNVLSRGEVFLEASLVYNPLRAGLRSTQPREAIALQQTDKFNRRVLLANVRRVASLVRTIIMAVQFVNSVFSWENRVLSVVSLMIFVYGCLFFQYWIPCAVFAAIFVGQYLRMTILPSASKRQACKLNSVMETTSESEGSESEDLEEETTQTLTQKVRRVQEVLTTTQHVLGFMADLGEQVKNLFLWSVPFCCWMAVSVLLAAAGVLYFIPPRFIVLLWGLNKFSKRLRNPNHISNNELLDFLSRIPTDKQLVQWDATRRVDGKRSKKSRKKK